jgi:XTP/dITP diphosphohydrolase
VQAFVATKNSGKLREIRAMFAGSELELATFDDYADVTEDADSYVGNALLKARALVEQLQDAGIHAAVLSDDSGLEVRALDGRPGVYSARYAGADTPWPARRKHLLDELQAVPPERRQARFVCAMAFVLPGGSETTVLETVDGEIVRSERGPHGFGYDPVFFYPPLQRTFAELDEDHKNRVSHRGRAAAALLKAIDGRV